MPQAALSRFSMTLPIVSHPVGVELAAKGHVKVILTINFGKLAERALEAAGITPTVISTPDAAEGASPLQHARCTVIRSTATTSTPA